MMSVVNTQQYRYTNSSYEHKFNTNRNLEYALPLDINAVPYISPHENKKAFIFVRRYALHDYLRLTFFNCII